MLRKNTSCVLFFRNDEGLRQRSVIVDKQKKTAEKVAEMKRKQQAAESWTRFKRSLFHPISLSIGIGALVLGGVVVYSYYISPRV